MYRDSHMARVGAVSCCLVDRSLHQAGNESFGLHNHPIQVVLVTVGSLITESGGIGAVKGWRPTFSGSTRGGEPGGRCRDCRAVLRFLVLARHSDGTIDLAWGLEMRLEAFARADTSCLDGETAGAPGCWVARAVRVCLG